MCLTKKGVTTETSFSDFFGVNDGDEVSEGDSLRITWCFGNLLKLGVLSSIKSDFVDWELVLKEWVLDDDMLFDSMESKLLVVDAMPSGVSLGIHISWRFILDS